MEDGHTITSRVIDSLVAVTTKPLKLIIFSTFLLEAHRFILFSQKGRKGKKQTKIKTEARNSSPPAGSRTI